MINEPLMNVISAGIVVGFGLILISWLFGSAIGLIRSLIIKMQEV